MFAQSQIDYKSSKTLDDQLENNNPFISNTHQHSLLSASILDQAIQELCPFPGYHGTYCPKPKPTLQSESRILQQSIPKMPSGIGASFDISTGQLKLPAIQLTYINSTSIYKDPVSGRQFTLANEMKVESVNLDADIKIFKNEFELTNIWLEATKRGQWLGGEYSQSKDLNDVFQKFFKGNKETSISQLLKNVVRLTFKTSNLKLNKFAQRAIDALPQAYQPQIYNEFLDSWGTHISVDTYIGGMIERQTVLKDCIYASKSFTGGLSPDQVIQALKNELHGKPGDEYFTARRQVSINHKFGGNPENAANWESTISQNPALLRINKFISWDSMATNPQIKVNLQKAISNRIEAMKQKQQSYQAQIKEQRRIQSNASKPAYAISGLGRVPGYSKSSVQIKKQFVLKETSQCPVGLAYEISKDRCSSGNMDKMPGFLQEVRYERDNQGNFRIVLLNPLSSMTHTPPQFYGSFVDRGCSITSSNTSGPQYSDLKQTPPESSLFKMICTDCLPTVHDTSNGQQLKCQCPGF